jgi:hypothetical protein
VALLDEPSGASPDEAERLLARIEEVESDLAARIERDRAEKSGLVWDETHHLGRIGIWRDRVAARRQRPVAVEP